MTRYRIEFPARAGGSARRCLLALLLSGVGGCSLFFPDSVDPRHLPTPGNPFDAAAWKLDKADGVRENLERLIAHRRDLPHLRAVVTNHGGTCSVETERVLQCNYRKIYQDTPYGLLQESALSFDVSATGSAGALSSLKVCVTRQDRSPREPAGTEHRATTTCNQ